MAKKIAFRLLFPILSIIFLSMIFAFYLVYQNEKEKILNTFLDEMQFKVSITKNNLSFWMQEQISTAITLSSNQDLIDFLSNTKDINLLTKVENNLLKFYKNAEYYENIAVVVKLKDKEYVVRNFNDKEFEIYNAGTIIDTVGGKTLAKGSLKMPFVYKALIEGKVAISKPYPSLRRKNPIVVISVPVRKSNQIIGGLIVAIKLTYFVEKYIKNIDIGENGFLSVVDADGNVIVHKNREYILKQNIKSKIHGRELLSSDEYMNNVEVDNENVWIRSNKENITSWHIIAHGYESDILKKQNRFAFKLFVLFLAVTLGIFILVYIFTYKIVSLPLKKITQSLDNFSIDNFQILQEFDTSTHEFICIKDSFGQMSDMLSASYLELKYSQNLFRSVSNSIDALIFYKDKNSIYIGFNNNFAQYIGKKDEEILGKSDFELFDYVTALKVIKTDKEILETGESSTIIFNGKYPDGREVAFQIIKSLLKDSSGQVIGIVGVAYDITKQRELERVIEYQAYYDDLTKLPNRALLQEHFIKSIATAKRKDEKLAVLFIDLDHFKYINDTFGHDIGDEVLKVISKRFNNIVRESDIIARLGGDEFLIIYNNFQSLDNVLLYAKKLIDVASKECYVSKQTFLLSASIGISIFPDDGTDQITLMKHADTAMYKAKEFGRNNMQFFESKMSDKAQEEMIILNSIRSAIDNREFFLVYQPQVDSKTSKLVGVEALVRWNSKDFGLVYPDKFISISESTGMIIPLGKWILEEACRQQLEWEKRFNISIKVAVNVSIRQFQHTNFIQTVSDIIRDSKINPNNLELEVTEGISMHKVDNSLHVLNELKLLGVSIAMDDFGTGYSSLAYLKKFPIDKLKIDQAFIRDCSTDKDDRMLIETIVAIAKGLGMQSVAEGVETQEHMDFLRELSCDILQGYYFDKPLEVTMFEEKYLALNQTS